jgi:ATP-dependent RNA helicase HelY
VSPSPAERYARSRERAQQPALAQFMKDYPFQLDPFQIQACTALETGSGVLVAAPTGSGKTVVGEFAVHLALREGVKCFYTTPIKALSNQKFTELSERYGPEKVGLLTGDNSINGEAPIVVMTTEVLRNMLYAGSSTIESLGYVVMDEVHYLADRFRGAVWEEVIIHLPQQVTVIALSATVSNAEEFGAWLATVRGSTEIVVEEHRPVPLWQHVMAGHHLYDLFVDDHTVNAELLALARRSHHRGPSGRGGRHDRRGRGRRRDSLTPWRSEVVEKLDTEDLLPCIYFLFSRAGCDDAVEQCLRSGLRLTSSAERQTIRAVVGSRTMTIADEDLAALGYVDWAEALERGIAAHHAGMLPVFKEIVEDLFQRGLIKVVFATETLALGINMPARSVVLERLVKWNGEAHVDLTAGEYTQLTGRAGRRGIDIEGHAVVVWSDELDPEVLAGLASTRTYPLRSSFQASYNMAINLVGQMGRAKAREVLETSFAQFQADQSVVGLSAEVRKLKEAQAGYAESMHCHLGDFTEYAALREEITQKEKNAGRTATAQLKSGAEECLARMRPGDVFVIPRGKRSGPAVVIASADRPHDPRPQVLTHERQVRRVSTVDVPIAVPTLGRIKVPKNFSAKDATMRRDLARKAVSVAEDADHRTPPATSNHDDQVSAVRARMRAHPCHGCQDREAHARWAERYFRAQRQIADLERRIATRTHSIARQFDRVCETLVDLGYLEGQGDDLRITESGRMLGGLYSESDLLIAQCLKAGQWNDLQPAELAAVVACVVYQSRRSEGDIRPAVPGGPVETAVDELFRTWATLSDVERAHRLPPGSEPDAGLAWAIYRWAKGASLLTILTSNDVSAGDFVRWTRQVIDVLGQIHQAAGDATLRDIADRAAAAIDRGVVGYTPVLE